MGSTVHTAWSEHVGTPCGFCYVRSLFDVNFAPLGILSPPCIPCRVHLQYGWPASNSRPIIRVVAMDVRTSQYHSGDKLYVSSSRTRNFTFFFRFTHHLNSSAVLQRA